MRPEKTEKQLQKDAIKNEQKRQEMQKRSKIEQNMNQLKKAAYQLSLKHGLDKEAELILEEERRIQLLKQENDLINQMMDGFSQISLNRKSNCSRKKSILQTEK